MRWALLLLWLACLVCPVSAEDAIPREKSKDKKDDAPGELVAKKTGRPGELTSEEEDKIDRIVDNFILFDTGVRRDAKSRSEFEDLGVEGIPGLVRGLNKSAKMSQSCPASIIAKKIKRLVRETDDPKTLDFIRENAGAGVGRTPYHALLSDLKVATMLRKSELDRERQQSMLRQSRGSSPGERGPGEGKPE